MSGFAVCIILMIWLPERRLILNKIEDSRREKCACRASTTYFALLSSRSANVDQPNPWPKTIAKQPAEFWDQAHLASGCHFGEGQPNLDFRSSPQKIVDIAARAARSMRACPWLGVDGLLQPLQMPVPDRKIIC
jgi:hypothetical protein